jgi:dTDP-4-amino-4,6-dideoxygalactose transaminase
MVLTKSKFGMFFIPGFGRKEDLDLPVSCCLHELWLALPVYADMTTNDIKQVVDVLREVLR